MTPDQALANVQRVCESFQGYDLAGARAVEQSLQVIAAAIQEAAPPQPTEEETEGAAE